jgi:energy-coupling factor transporter transmembrane protein EcfT
MIQSKFSLADLLTVLGTLGYGFFCFLSINFLTLGDTTTSIIGAVLISSIIGGLAFGVKLLKRTSRNFKTFIIWEWILIFLFIVVAFFAIFPFSHYFVVSAQKENIQKKVISNITQAEGLFLDYELYADSRLNRYKSLLNSIILAKIVDPNGYTNFGFIDGTDDNIQVENKMFTLKAKLYPSNYLEMKQIDSTWLSDSKDKVKSWSPTGIVKVVNTLKVEISSWSKQLKSYSSFRAQGEAASDFDFPLTFDDVSSKFNQSTTPNLIALIIGIALYLLMFLSYFITRRHSKNHYTLFGKKTESINDGIDIKY